MLKKIALILLKAYQMYIRGALPSTCRFLPSCSEYARQAFLKYGFFQASLKSAKRLLCCHPFSGKAGDDPLI
jgi:putative membrane protein insertion efficiency factor